MKEPLQERFMNGKSFSFFPEDNDACAPLLFFKKVFFSSRRFFFLKDLMRKTPLLRYNKAWEISLIQSGSSLQLFPGVFYNTVV